MSNQFLYSLSFYAPLGLWLNIQQMAGNEAESKIWTDQKAENKLALLSKGRREIDSICGDADSAVFGIAWHHAAEPRYWLIL